MAAVRYSGYLLFLVLAVILFSCEYEPAVSFTKVNQNVEPPSLSLGAYVGYEANLGNELHLKHNSTAIL